jgi:DNA-binding NtrC family response regulator
VNYEAFIADVERNMIVSILQAYNGNVTKSADYLELKRTTLIAKIERLGIKVEQCVGYNETKAVAHCVGYNETKAVAHCHRISGLNVIKRDIIIEALKKCEYNRHRASIMVGMSYRTISSFVRDMKAEGMIIPDRTDIKWRK